MNLHKIATVNVETWVENDSENLSQIFNMITSRAQRWRILGGALVDSIVVFSLEAIQDDSRYHYISVSENNVSLDTFTANVTRRYYDGFRLVFAFTLRATCFALFEEDVTQKTAPKDEV